MAEVRPSYILPPGGVFPDLPTDAPAIQGPRKLIQLGKKILDTVPSEQLGKQGDSLKKSLVSLSLELSSLSSDYEKQEDAQKKIKGFVTLGKQVTESYEKHLRSLSNTPKDLRGVIAGLQSYRDLQEQWKKDTKFLPGKVEVTASVQAYALDSLHYSEDFSPIVLKAVERSCAELGGFYSLLDSTMFFCVESLDKAIASHQDTALQKRLKTFKENFIKCAYSLSMYKQLRFLQSDKVSLTDFVCVFPLEKVVLQKKELGAYLDLEFEHLFSLFEILYQNEGRLDCTWQTKKFPSPQRCLMLDVLSRFFKMEREGLQYQKKFLKIIGMFSPEKIFDDLQECCTEPQKWLHLVTGLAAMRIKVLEGAQLEQRKRKDKEHEELRSAANRLFQQTDVLGTKSYYKSYVDMYLQANPFPFLVRWLNNCTAQAIEGLASVGLPDEFHLWFSEVNIVRLGSLLEYAQSFFRGKASTSNGEMQSKQIVREFCLGIGKAKVKELQTILSEFLNSLGQLKNTISSECAELFKCKCLERFLQENLTTDNMRNQNFLAIDWLATQVSGNDALSRHLESFILIHQRFTDSLRKFLLSKSLPQPAAKKVLEQILSHCSASFFSEDHEAIIALKLYSQQWGLLNENPRGEKEISLGFDESLTSTLQALQQELFPQAPEEVIPKGEPETHVPQEVEPDFSSTSPSSTSTDSSENSPEFDTLSVDALVEEVASISLCPSPEQEPSSTPIPEPRKKLKKQKLQKEKLSPAPETKPSPAIKEEVKLPLYWRQYCDPRKLIKLVESAGFDLVRIKGSHHIFIKKVEDGSILPLSIPYHSAEDIDPGLARKILLLIMKFHVIE